jgi:nucleotidyltransferase/DNA polymerase involved in DNA repair
LRALSTLSEIKGIGLCHAVTLESVGVHTPVELAQQNPAELVERMSRKVSPNLAPSEAVTRIWIVAARAWTHQHAPDTLQPQKPSLWERFLEEDVPPENKPEETPLDLAHKAEASSRTQSPTLPQAVHQTESTSQPREMVLLPPQPTQAPRTVSTPSLDSTETLPTSEVGQTTESEETKDRLDETTRTQPTADNTDRKTTETLSAKPPEESQKAQEQTSATEPVRPAEMIPHTTATQAEKLETKDPRTTATQTGKPETKEYSDNGNSG